MARGIMSSSKSSSSLNKAKPKREAKMFSSCDACKLRKVKCDRSEKILSKRASAGASLNLEEFSALDHEVCCSNCSQRNFECVYSQVPVKTRKGKVLKTLFEKQEQQNLTRSETQITERERSVASSGSGSYSHPSSTEIVSLSLVSGELFSLLGLNETILENCFSSFFAWIEPITPMLSREVFRERYERYSLSKKTGMETLNPNATNELFDSYDEPASEFWILSILICGSGSLTPEMEGYSRRFQIQEDFGRIFRDRLFSSGGIERLVNDDLDAIEALFFLWGAAFELPSHNEIDSRALITRNHSSSFVVSLTSLEGINRFAEKLGLNYRADRKQMRGKLLSVRDMERRSRPFFYNYSYDAVFSFSSQDGTRLYWTNDHHSHGIPEFLRMPGASDEMELENLMEPFSSPLFQIHFGAAWSLASFKWALLVRKWRKQFLSPRIQEAGIGTKQLLDCLEVMESYRTWMPQLVSWDYLVGLIDGDLLSLPGNPRSIVPGNEAHQDLLKTIQLEFTQSLTLLNLADAVEAIGFERNPRVDSWEIALVKFKLDQSLTSAFWRAVEVVRAALPLRLLRGNVRIIRTCLCALIAFGSKRIDGLMEEAHDSSVFYQFLDSLKVLIDGVKQAGDCNRDNPNIVSSQEEILNCSTRKVDFYIERAKNSSQTHNLSGLNIPFDNLMQGSNLGGNVFEPQMNAPSFQQQESNPDWMWKSSGNFDDMLQF